MKKILFIIGLTILILGCNTTEIQSMEDKETGHEIVFVRSKVIARSENEIETDKKTILTFVVGKDETAGTNASKFIVTRERADSISGQAFDIKADKNNYKKVHILDTGYTIDLDEVRVSSEKDMFKIDRIANTEKEFHTLGIPTGISSINYNLTDEEVDLLYDIYKAQKVYLSVTDTSGRVYSGEVTQKEETIKVLELMKSNR